MSTATKPPRTEPFVYHAVVIMMIALSLGAAHVLRQLRSECMMPTTLGGLFVNDLLWGLFMCTPALLVVAAKWWAYRRSEGEGVHPRVLAYLALALGLSAAFAAAVTMRYDDDAAFHASTRQDCGR